MCFPNSGTLAARELAAREFVCECICDRDGNCRCNCVRRRDVDDIRRRFICREVTETGFDGIARRRFVCTEVRGEAFGPGVCTNNVF